MIPSINATVRVVNLLKREELETQMAANYLRTISMSTLAATHDEQQHDFMQVRTMLEEQLAARYPVKDKKRKAKR